MPSLVSKLPKRFKGFRRRHRIVPTMVLLLVVVYLVFFQLRIFAEDPNASLERSVIIDPDDTSFSLSKLLSYVLPSKSKKKTIPFKQTDAGAPIVEDTVDEINFQAVEGTSSSSYDDKIRKKVVKSPSRSKGSIQSQNAKAQLAIIKELEARKLRVIKDLHDKFYSKAREHNRRAKAYKFFEDIFTVFHNGKPKIPPLRKYLSDDRIYHARYDTKGVDETVFSEKYLSGFLQLDEEELESMKESHRYILENLPEKAPKGVYSGNGIVYVGGGNFNWLTLLSIKSIRAIGCKLPIEVVIPTIDEFEADLCARIFPALGARCIYMPYALSDPENTNSVVSKFHLNGYQYKALAILVSSFENILLLDSDNIPVHPPDDLFNKEPFKSNGLIVWPDFWKRATSPDYYKIAGLSPSDSKLMPKYDEVAGRYNDAKHDTKNPLDLDDIPLHDRAGSIPDPTSESGQLMISKKTHTKALLLALYYNLYGPSHFYPLFSQGSDGEGDKETFLAATVATGNKFYQVSKFLNAFGHFNIKHEFEGTGMGQYNPVEDYEYNLLRQRADSMSEKQVVQFKKKNTLFERGPQILFVHANFPKLNPWTLKIERKFFNEKGERFRLYGSGMKVRTGYDFETVQWTNMKYLLCDLKIDLEIYSDVDRSELCSEIFEHLAFLRSTIHTLE
ncbi:hypothetical protein G9P44_006255 [Scheffersomyces stipitis]|nr:hypothetical protein G9P44_006255 [Scheffersomyces stipitis]